MATDLEAGTDQGELATSRPNLKIVGLHIRGLKSIASLDLPEDGLGWDETIPDFVMVGGINGSGKSTLLKFLADVFDQKRRFEPRVVDTVNAWVDFQFESPGFSPATVRYIIGDKDFIEKHKKDKDWFGHEVGRIGQKAVGSGRFHDRVDSRVMGLVYLNQIPIEGDAPGLVYFPSEGRTLVIPETSFKMPGKLTPSEGFLQFYEPPKEWKDSLPARMYGARWEDLNAKEAGRPELATHFRSYQLAFDRFFEGRKQIKWAYQGELVVETKSGAIHELSELSSGEKQVILFMGELLHRWRPGSMILIDEPELHLHESYQTRLWEALVDWQKERGGQVILATQSDHLFGLSGPGTRVILGGRLR